METVVLDDFAELSANEINDVNGGAGWDDVFEKN